MKEQSGEPVPQFRERTVKDFWEEHPFVTPTPNHIGEFCPGEEANVTFLEQPYLVSIDFYEENP